MDEEVSKAIEILNEDLRRPGLNRQNSTDQSSKKTDAPNNCGDGILQTMPGTSAKAKKDLAAKVKRSRKKISEALTALRHSLHRDSKAKAKESIRNLMLIKSRSHTISKESRPSTSNTRLSSATRKRNRDSPAKKRKGNRPRKDEKPILFVAKSSSTSQSSSIESFESGSSSDDVSQRGARRRT